MTTIRTLAAALVALLFAAVAALSGPPPVAGIAAPAPLPACTEEDGSEPGQAFPCAWTGGANGLGRHYVLTMPICSRDQVAAADAAHRAGTALELTCDDAESLIGEWI